MSETVSETTATEAQPAETQPPAAFTQDQVNAMLAEQKRKQSEKFGDLAELKAKADRLAEIEESQKSEQQRHADAAAKAQRDAEDARAEALRYKAAATHKVDPDYFDLLGNGDEDTISSRAERVGGLLALRTENEALKAELEALRSGRPAPTNGRPTTALKPGATPEHAQTEDDALYAALYGPER